MVNGTEPKGGVFVQQIDDDLAIELTDEEKLEILESFKAEVKTRNGLIVTIAFMFFACTGFLGTAAILAYLWVNLRG